MSETAAYELCYWPGLPGRGEFVRLAFEEAGVFYHDTGDATPGTEATPSFAPPFLKHGDLTIGQTANILFYLGPRLGLAPEDEPSRLWLHQIQLTIMDFVGEVHDTHHPIGSQLYYEEQKAEARRRAEGFRETRLPKFLHWFETVLARNPAGSDWLATGQLTYADLSLFQTIEGLNYAMPRQMAATLPKYPLVAALHGRVAGRPNIKAYRESGRRQGFNENGIFRHYPELDGTN